MGCCKKKPPPPEENVRRELDKKYKAYFDEYHDCAIPFPDLKVKLREAGVSQLIPEGRMEAVFHHADVDHDNKLDYEEFVSLMISDDHEMLRSRELSRFQKLVKGAVSTVVPNRSVNEDQQYVVDDYISNYNCRPPPFFMILVSIAEVVIFIYYAVQSSGTKNPVTATSGAPIASPLIFNPSRRYEAWRYVSYMFLHDGYVHLIFNLIFQLLIGIPLEMVHKWWRLGLVYVLGVIAGSLCHSVFDVNILLAGASGGCYALIGAHFAIVIMNWEEMTHDWMDGVLRILLSAPVRLIWWTIFVGIDIGIAIYQRYVTHESTGVGYAAHLGGAVCGVLIGIPVLKNLDVKPWERVVFWIALTLYSLCVVFAVLFNVFYPNYPETDRRPCCPEPDYWKN